MVVDLVAVLEVGGVRGDSVPREARTDIAIQQGQDVTFRLTCWRSDGSVCVIALADTIVLSIKKQPFDPLALLSLTGTRKPAEGPGRADFTLAKADTLQLPSGNYFFDVWLTQNSKNDPVLLPSGLRIAASVKR